jgi:alpha-L-fucosidase
MLDAKEEKILAEITDWMRVNGEAIYATRPWKIYGAGPSTQVAASDPKFNESKRKELTAEDIRFTTKGNTLFVFLMGWPQKQAVIEQLATDRIDNVEMLGYKGKLQWTQDETGLKVQMPAEKPCNHAVALKISRGQ